MIVLTHLLLEAARSTDGYNAGALAVARKLLDHKMGETALNRAIQDGVTGGELWLLHKDVCGEITDLTLRRLLDHSAVERLADCPGSKFYEGSAS